MDPSTHSQTNQGEDTAQSQPPMEIRQVHLETIQMAWYEGYRAGKYSISNTPDIICKHAEMLKHWALEEIAGDEGVPEKDDPDAEWKTFFHRIEVN